VRSEQSLAKFLKLEMEHKTSLAPFVNLDAGAPMAARVLALRSALSGRDDGPTSVFIRSCYVSHMQRVLSAFDSENGGMLLAGTRGIGKSVFGTLMVLECAQRGHMVVYEHVGTRLLLVGERVSDEVAAILARNEYEPITQPGVYAIAQSDDVLFGALVSVKDVVFVQDLGDSPKSTAIKMGSSRWLVVSSPNADKLRYLRNQSFMKRLVMPLWSLQELQDAREQVYQQLPATRYAGYSAEEVAARFEIYGGVPRWVLERPRARSGYFMPSEEELEKAVKTVGIDELQGVFRAATYIDIPQQKVTGILIHVVPADEEGGPLENDPPRCTFASKIIRERMVDELLDRQQFGVSTFINAVQIIPELGGYRGYALEHNAHRNLPKGPEVSLRLLGERATSSTILRFRLPRLARVVSFASKDLTDLVALAPLEYARPASKTFPTLDSFAVLPLLTFEPGAKGQCLAMFQVTVSGSHDVDGSVLKRVHAKVHDLLGMKAKEKLPMVLVFVTDVNGIKTRQKIQTAKGDDYAQGFGESFQQFALLLGSDFDRLAEFSRVEE
jgi:hypothetical protein